MCPSEEERDYLYVSEGVCELTVCMFVFVPGAALVAVRLKKPQAAPRNGCSVNGCPMD